MTDASDTPDPGTDAVESDREIDAVESGSGTDDADSAPAYSESEVRTVVLSLVAGVFFGGMGGGVAFPTIPALGSVLGIAPLLVGVILSINRFTRLLMSTPAGSVLDRMGTRRPMIAGFAVQGLVPFGYLVGLSPPLGIPSSAVFLVSRAAWGIGSAFVFVGAFSTVTHVTTAANRGRWVGYMRGGQSLGFPTGLILGGIVTELYGYAEAFAVAGVAGLFAAAVAYRVLPNVSPDVGEKSRLRDVPTLVRADPRIGAVGAVNFTIRFLYAGVLLSTVVLYTEANDISLGGFAGTGTSGVVMAVSVLALSASNLAVGRLSDSLGRTTTVVPGLGVFAAGFALAALVPTARGVLVGVGLVGAGAGLAGPPLLAYLGDIAPDGDVGKLGGVYNVFGDLGSTLGPLVALPLAARIGLSGEYLACAGLVLVAIVIAATTLRDDSAAAVEAATADD
ncbi:MFS transporter [Halobaculum sp. CBA1158]|uniref:MFS transporter n=1 Tax=Halobaculum sp. CBA1158 TaxID=2904243 RepID=UPI001F1AF7D2|nr:MFS transporter [Halobaculum sp. CBA1158]UIO99592.1 MFS transporter [Halobaculum sp. CBA1158]